MKKPRGKKRRIGLTAQSPRIFCRCFEPEGFRNHRRGKRAVIVCVTCRMVVPR